MYIPRDTENLSTPTSFANFHEIAMDTIFGSVLKCMLGHRKAQEGANFAECLTFSSNGAARAVYCPHCATPNVKKNGVKANGQQNFYCKDCRKQPNGRPRPV